jgi:hypothetical protein
MKIKEIIKKMETIDTEVPIKTKVAFDLTLGILRKVGSGEYEKVVRCKDCDKQPYCREPWSQFKHLKYCSNGELKTDQ